jgi:hypothetical protein
MVVLEKCGLVCLNADLFLMKVGEYIKQANSQGGLVPLLGTQLTRLISTPCHKTFGVLQYSYKHFMHFMCFVDYVALPFSRAAPGAYFTARSAQSLRLKKKGARSAAGGEREGGRRQSRPSK